MQMNRFLTIFLAHIMAVLWTVQSPGQNGYAEIIANPAYGPDG